ncbi:MAG: iron-sulfur cluster insertion protein ErpA [Rhodospirillales bacterium]|nr:iron-sulfur cluster insertion protein ErpA [Rhodospirillales bacterium]
MPDTPVQDTGLAISETAARRIRAIAAAEGDPGLMLRVTVSGGGCSGFQYAFKLDSTRAAEDRVFEQGGVTVVVDETSLDLVKGSTLDFVEDLVGSYFKMTNPNAVSTCGCGSSFSVV